MMSELPEPELNPYAPPRSKLGSTTTAPGGIVLGYAGFWRRFAALLIDSILLGAALMGYAVAILGMLALVPGNDPTAMLIVIAVAYLIAIFLSIAYFVMMECSSSQATLGKAALGIRVTDLYGQRISFARSLGRYFGKMLSSIALIGYIMAAFTERKQALHDILAGTLVVVVR